MRNTPELTQGASLRVTARPTPLHTRCVVNNACPFPECRDQTFTTLGTCIAHIKNAHIRKQRNHHFTNSEATMLREWAGQHAYYFCASHLTLNRANVSARHGNGELSLTYLRCKHCPRSTPTPPVVPPHPSQFATASIRNPVPGSPPHNPNAHDLTTEDPIPLPDATPPPAPAQDSTHSQIPNIADICQARIPIMKHIPFRIRNAVARAFGQALWKVPADPSTNQSHEAYTKLFLFPAAILSTQNTRDRSSATQAIRNRLALWEAGQYTELWETALNLQIPNTPRPQTGTSSQAAANARRAASLARDGAFSKAAAALTSSEIPPPTAERANQLRAKHPPADANPPRMDPAPTDRLPEFSTADICTAINKFDRTAAGGGSGLRPNHLQEMLQASNPDTTNPLLRGLTRLVNILATGNGPEAFAPWLAGAPLIGLNKPNGDVRPIAIGETIRRLVSSCLMAKVSNDAEKHFAPRQLGVGSKSGCETIYHSLQAAVAEHGSNPSLALLQVDFTNAFNLISRTSFFAEIRRHFPTLSKWVEYCYSAPAHLWYGDHNLTSSQGVQQGDPLASLLFAAALQPILNELWQSSKDEERLLAFYLDDGYAIGTYETLSRFLHILNSDSARKRGLHLNLSKCKIWWPTRPDPANGSTIPDEVPRQYGPGTTVLNAPLGSNPHIRSAFTAHVDSLSPFFEKIGAMEDTHVAYNLLRNCFGTCRLAYLLRLLPPSLTKPGCTKFDQAMLQCFQNLIDGNISAETWSELQLPVISPSKNTASFGAGLHSAVTIAPCAYLSSLFTSSHRSESVFGSLPMSPSPHASELAASFQAWKATCRDHDSCTGLGPLHTWSASRAPSQRCLTAAAHAGIQAALPPGDLRTASFRKCLSIPGAKDWLNCLPTPSFHSWIPPREFCTWFKFFCRIPLYNRSQECGHPACPATMDIHGDHALICAHGNSRIFRHDSLVRAVAKRLSEAARTPTVEPRDNGSTHHSRPDISTLGSDGQCVQLDVTVVHPLTASRLPTTASTPTSCLHTASLEKRRQHRGTIAAGNRLIPMAVQTLGGWHEAAWNFIRETADSRALRLNSRRPLSRVRCRSHFAATLATRNAACLLAAIAS